MLVKDLGFNMEYTLSRPPKYLAVALSALYQAFNNMNTHVRSSVELIGNPNAVDKTTRYLREN